MCELCEGRVKSVICSVAVSCRWKGVLVQMVLVQETKNVAGEDRTAYCIVL